MKKTDIDYKQQRLNCHKRDKKRKTLRTRRTKLNKQTDKKIQTLSPFF